MNDTEREYWVQHQKPRDGESFDGAGNIRPVPPGVPMRPERRRRA